jgi:GDSL-like Lipase/Acylhydrolase family
MRSRLGKLLSFTLLTCGVLAFRALAQDHASRPEEVEWTWEVRPAHIDLKLPNVLLVGDSITRNYYPEVQRQLADVANVYLFAASTSIGDSRLPHQLDEFSAIEAVPFKVVHFNNGMHGWTYSEEEYKIAFPSYLHALHKIAPKASFVWATITPVRADEKPGPTNARIEDRNSIAQSFVAEGGIQLDDQHALMIHHEDLYEDNVHFNAAGALIQGQQAAQSIRTSMAKR